MKFFLEVTNDFMTEHISKAINEIMDKAILLYCKAKNKSENDEILQVFLILFYYLKSK